MRVAPACVVLALIAAGSAQAAVPTPAWLRSEIMRQGAKAVVTRLVGQGAWEAVSDRIASGQSDWLALAPLLAEGTDAGTSEDLGIDLAFALPKNPAAVLQVVNEAKWGEGGVIGVERVCGVPFIEDTEPHNYRRKAVGALSTVVEPALQDKKQKCLAELRHVAP